MEQLAELRERLRTQRPVAWEQLPDFSLYMDQVLSYMDRQVLRFGEDDGLTAAMVNNYTKSGLLPRADGKKYGREHLAYLTCICILKRVMSVRDMGTVLNAELGSGKNISDNYESFRDSLDKALNLITDVMEAYLDETDAADGAIHFALLSYAAGLASDRFLSILRAEGDQPEESPKKSRGRREKKAESAKEPQAE
ncbi:MAG: DUF1836 domain-containing protein [Oscillibacter sp.]|nr:DUF1836 domain-containing protein [Oscillibacter sp.]